MTKRLTIDRGNTALKAAIWDGCGHLGKVVTLPAHACMADVLGAFDGVSVGAVGYSSVVRDVRDADLDALSVLACPVYDVKGGISLPFAVAYDTPATLGADRIAANGDVANKIGTYSLAVLAHYHQIPFYVAAPQTTLDRYCPNGAAIPIEQRAAAEVTGVAGSFGAVQWAPTGAAVYNPAFDVTPAGLISGWVLDSGVVTPAQVAAGAFAPDNGSRTSCRAWKKRFSRARTNTAPLRQDHGYRRGG